MAPGLSKAPAPPPAPAPSSLLDALGIFSTFWGWFSSKIPSKQSWLVIVLSAAATYVVIIYGDTIVGRVRSMHSYAVSSWTGPAKPAPMAMAPVSLAAPAARASSLEDRVAALEAAMAELQKPRARRAVVK